MAPARTVRGRVLNNENDENNSTRVTRAKAAALSVPSDASLAAKKPLQAKKGATNTKPVADGPLRKRSALGDVSNVQKGDAADRGLEDKKATGRTNGLVSKAAQPQGIQKASRTNSTRTVLGSKEKSTASSGIKRPASSTAMHGETKKRDSGRRASDDESQPDENVAPSSDNVKVKITETVKTETRTPDGAEVKKEVKREGVAFESAPKGLSSEEKLRQQIEMMDEEDVSDPLMVSEYVYEIFEYMKELEQRTMPNADYMTHQGQLEWKMRGILIDWLLEVHTRFHLLPETFYLTVNILDRFLTHKIVQLERLQLVGVTAMFIASKYEEVLSPHIANFVHVADDGFSEAEILSAERFILQTLDYDLSYANPMHFMRRISKGDNYDIQTRTLAKYLLEISLLDHRFLAFPPSVNAAASMHLSRVILEKGKWDEILQHYSGYAESEIMESFETMCDYLRSPVTHNAFYKKYAGKKFLKASLHARAWAKAHAHEWIGPAP